MKILAKRSSVFFIIKLNWFFRVILKITPYQIVHETSACKIKLKILKKLLLIENNPNSVSVFFVLNFCINYNFQIYFC